jgi:hypothetical protein
MRCRMGKMCSERVHALLCDVYLNYLLAVCSLFLLVILLDLEFEAWAVTLRFSFPYSRLP